jgi:chloramphenicol 3-O phosphotransferase
MDPAQIVILNGAPRSGKSSIVAVIQDAFPGIWMNLGADTYIGSTPPKYRPGIGLRPGGENPPLEEWVPVFYEALYESIAAHSRLGLNVVVDAGFHEHYSRGLGILRQCALRLEGLPVLFVGIQCPIETIMERRNAGHEGRSYVTGSIEDPPEPVRRWQREIHRPGWYDLEVDTSAQSPAECAEAIRRRLEAPEPGPTAFERLALLNDSSS